MKILLVDDDPVACAVYTLMLEAQGHQVVQADDGEKAWELVQDREISMVLSDWMMPNLAGVDLCRRIRSMGAMESERYVYVILCTSKGAKSDLIEGMDAGADDFLVKPIAPEELRVKVRAGERVLSLQQGLAEKNLELARINRQLKNAHMLVEADLKAAAWMQQRLLPEPAQQAHGVRCEWRLEPSGYIAGDIFNCFAMNEDKTGFYLLDVCGHGVPAAMLSVSLSMMLTPDATHGSPLVAIHAATGKPEVLSPGDAVRELNRRFQSIDDRYFTMIYGVFSIATSSMQFAQAGHPGPVLMKKGQRPEILGEGGMPVGLWPKIEFHSFEVSVSPGDRLLLYSDGVTECYGESKIEFGEARLARYLGDHGDLPLNALLDGLLEELRRWRGGADCSDDISLFAIEVTG